MKLTFLAAVTLTLALVRGQESSFVESDGAEHFKNRNLLQENEGENVEGGRVSEKEEESNKYTTDIQNGPELFYDGKDFLMKVDTGIVINVYDASNPKKVLEKIILNKPVTSIKGGGAAGSTSFSVTLDWKDESFGTGSIKIGSIILKMTFARGKKEFTLTAMEVSKATVGGENIMDNKLKVTTSYGYRFNAPLGLGFCCDSAGVFSPQNSTSNNKYSLGVTLPGVKVQVFDVKSTKFGPSWYCGEFLTIGVWVGLIISLGFAFVCYWGFSMLANIQTNDRFDDPKGKPIHVPTSE